jgi:hypothetical protein
MTDHEFARLFEDVVKHERATLINKARDYGNAKRRLWNFYRGAEIVGTTPALTLWGFLGKHLTSISDMCHGKPADRDTIREKIGDARNYLVLLEALLVEKLRPKIIKPPEPAAKDV